MKPTQTPYSIPEFINEAPDPVADALAQLRLVIQREQGPYLTDVLREIIAEARKPRAVGTWTDKETCVNGPTPKRPYRRSAAGRERQRAAMRAYWKKRKAAKGKK